MRKRKLAQEPVDGRRETISPEVPMGFLLALAASLLGVPGFFPLPSPVYRLPASSRLVATFSIVARDPSNGDLGVAVQSKFPNVRVAVPYARAGVGAVATQSFSNSEFGTK